MTLEAAATGCVLIKAPTIQRQTAMPAPPTIIIETRPARSETMAIAMMTATRRTRPYTPDAKSDELVPLSPRLLKIRGA